MMTAFPAMLYLVAGVRLVFYQQDLDTVRGMQTDLEARCAAEESGAAAEAAPDAG